MVKYSILLFWFTLVLVGTGNTFAANLNSAGITVHGQASISVEPDQAVLSFQLVKQGRGVQKLKAYVDQKTAQVIEQLARYNIAKGDIQTSQTRITPIFKEQAEVIGAEVRDRSRNPQTNAFVALSTQPKEPEVERFRIARTVNVVVKDLSHYDQLIDAVLKFGINQLNHTHYRYSKSEQTYQQALSLAVENARSKALQLAKVSGRQLGPVVHVEEHSNAPVVATETFQAMRANYRTEHGIKTINARVEVHFIFN